MTFLMQRETGIVIGPFLHFLMKEVVMRKVLLSPAHGQPPEDAAHVHECNDHLFINPA